MDKEILNKFLVEMAELLKSAKDFTIEQAPQVAREVLHYRLASSLLAFAVGLAVFLCSILFFKHVQNMMKEDNDWAPMHILSCSFLGGSAIFVLENLDSIIKISLAPRLFLIEYFASLVAPHCK